MKKLFRKIGMWLLNISEAKSMNEMYDELNLLALKHGEDYIHVEISKKSYSNGLSTTIYAVYIHGKSWEQGETFNEAMKKMKNSFSPAEPVKQKDILI